MESQHSLERPKNVNLIFVRKFYKEVKAKVLMAPRSKKRFRDNYERITKNVR